MGYGSLVNHLYAASTKGQPEAVVGMGVTTLSWTDRDAGTIVKVEGNVITIQIDTATRIDGDGMSDAQEYSYEPNPDGARAMFRFNEKRGRWEEVYRNPETGRLKKLGSGGLRIGSRDKHYDFSF